MRRGACRRSDGSRVVEDVAALDQAGPGDLTFLDNPRYLDAFRATRASAALVAPRFAEAAPAGCAALIAREPYRAMAQVMAKLYPSAMKPGSTFVESRRVGRRACSPLRAARSRRRRRPRRGDRAGRRDRRRHGDRRQRGHRSGRAHRPQRRGRRDDDDHGGADRRPGHHPSGRAYRPGRFRLRARRARPSQGAAGRPGHHPGRRRDRRRRDDRPGRQPRHGDRRRRQDR